MNNVIEKDYVNTVKQLMRIVAPAINAGVRLPEADIRTCRNIMDTLHAFHATIKVEE